MKGIVDCNSFYCSCERLFRPGLDDKPVVVLSNNDGCIISRSDEAKAVGVGMAESFFKAKAIIEEHHVATFSSNYHLYGDMSWRVMETLRTIVGKENVEVYSVDEAFIDLSGYDINNLQAVTENILQTVEMWTGIKVSIGVAPTKVLAKLANRLSKNNKQETKCVLVLDTEEKILDALSRTPVHEVWGVGRKYAEKLKDMHAVFSALDLRNKKIEWAHKNLGGVIGVRLVKELKGETANEIGKEFINKKMIATTRMFGHTVNNINDIKEAIATYTTKAAEKLRRQYSAASVISIFIVAKQQDYLAGFNRGDSFGTYTTLPIATSATNELIAAAVKLVDQLYDKNKSYKKAGVMLSGIVPDSTIQANLFQEPAVNNKRMLMNMIDNINYSMRDDKIKFASSGTKKDWKMRQEYRSPRYSTRWEEMMIVQ